MRHASTVQTFVLPNAAGPAVIGVPLAVPDQGDYELEAWIGNFGGSNVYVMAGDVNLAAAQSRLTDVLDQMDCLMALSAAGKSCCGIDEATRRVTLFFEGVNNSGQSQSVSLRVIGRAPER